MSQNYKVNTGKILQRLYLNNTWIKLTVQKLLIQHWEENQVMLMHLSFECMQQTQIIFVRKLIEHLSLLQKGTDVLKKLKKKTLPATGCSHQSTSQGLEESCATQSYIYNHFTATSRTIFYSLQGSKSKVNSPLFVDENSSKAGHSSIKAERIADNEKKENETMLIWSSVPFFQTNESSSLLFKNWAIWRNVCKLQSN